ncbi:protein Aster-B-like isoform X2 [Liolophura sinensis]|uniref:protein Aster-B-like isoform X2 n=1 Tax=Liolophura sinensis TaxID=3198878 RepID=UPI003158308C
MTDHVDKAAEQRRRSLDSVQYNSSQESLSTLSVSNGGRDSTIEESVGDSKDETLSRRSSFSGRVPTIQESDENHGGRRNSAEFEVIDDDTVDEALDVVNQNISALQNGLSGEESSMVGNDSDNNTPTRIRPRHRHHHHHCHQRDSGDSEKNNGGDQLSSDNREDMTPDRLVGTPDSDGPKFRPRDMSFDKSFDNLIERLNSESQGSLNKSETKSTASNGGGSDRETASKMSSDDIVVTVTKPSKVEKKKKSSALFTVLSPTYKSKTDDFKKTFKDIPNEERLIVDYSCALQKDILVHGRMFITQNWVCFYANIFRWETVLTIPCKDITAITKEKTARVIPNAIQITTEKEKYFFTSFAARDKTFLMLFRIWQNALLDQPMSPKELWHWVHYCYGEELGLTSSDEDYVARPSADEMKDKQKDEAGIIKEADSTTEVSVANGDYDGDCSAANVMSPDSFEEPPMGREAGGVTLGDEDPTDFGDTTDDSDGIGEVICTGHDHFEKMYMNEVFNMSVDKAFELLFTDSKFFRDFVGGNKTFDLLLPPWQEDLDDEGNRIRHIRYTLTLGAAFGPKHSPSTEKQICLKQSKAGVIYIIDCHIANGSIPYADSFYTVNRYCITRVSNSRCRIKVTSVVKYRKSVWGLVKNLIEKNAHHGITTYYKNLSIALHKEAGVQHDRDTLAVVKQPSKKKRRRRRLMSNIGDGHDPSRQTESLSTPPSPIRAFSIKEDRLLKLNADTLVRIIVFVLILLVMFNAMLFYKLWALEGFAGSGYPTSQHFSPNHIRDLPESQEEWLKLLEQQQSLHQSEVEHWREILGTSVLLMDQMKASLMELQSSLKFHESWPRTTAEPVKQHTKQDTES